MGRKVFLSFLGTNNYLACNYENSKGKIENVRFVQEAILQLECSKFTEEDRVFVFCTAEARKKNWVDLDEEKGLGQDPARLADPVLDRIGLYSRLVELKNSGKLQATFDQEPIFIEDGFSEQEVWKIFEAVYKVLEEGDEVYLDITHSFRFMPMLSIVLMNYAKLLKGVTIKSISYGAFEKLGPAYKLKSVPVEDRNAPIVDISSFAELQDWTNATNILVKTGSADELNQMTSLKRKAFFSQKGSKDQDEQTKILDQARATQLLSDTLLALRTNRGLEITKGEIFKQLNEAIQTVKNNLSSDEVLLRILDKVAEKISIFQPKTSWENGLTAVKWNIEHGLIQQGVTMLQEVIVTYICEEKGWSYTNRSLRERIGKILQGLSLYYAGKPTDALVESDGITQSCIEQFKKSEKIKSLVKVYVSMSRSIRNDINHGGLVVDIKSDGSVSGPKKGKDIVDKLKEYYKATQNAIYGIGE